MARSRAKRGSPWKPPALAGVPSPELNRFKYVVVEERIDDLVGLLVSEWPRGGGGGPPFFPRGGEEEEVVVDRNLLQRRLARRRVPDSTAAGGTRKALQERDVVVGDVYAARLAAGPDPQEVVDRVGVERWIEEIVDITAEGREAARAATYEALTPRLKPKVASALRRKAEERAR